MAIRKDIEYPGRWLAATTAYPMGEAKNRTTATSKDGSYLEKKWIQDYEAFFGALLNAAGVSPNGNVDTAEASQFFDAIINKRWTEFGNYSVGTIVTASDGNQYYCNQANGRDTTPVDPVSDTLDNWRQFPFEKITNANGTAIKHYNGDLECRAIISDPAQSQRVDFALAFTTGPLMTMGTDTQEVTDMVGRFKSKDATGFTVSLTGTSATPFAINYVAFGFWI